MHDTCGRESSSPAAKDAGAPSTSQPARLAARASESFFRLHIQHLPGRRNINDCRKPEATELRGYGAPPLLLVCWLIIKQKINLQTAYL